MSKDIKVLQCELIQGMATVEFGWVLTAQKSGSKQPGKKDWDYIVKVFECQFKNTELYSTTNRESRKTCTSE